MKKCSTSFSRQGNANQNYLRFHLTSVRMSIIKKTYNKCWWGCRVKGILTQCWFKSKLVPLLWINVEVFQEPKKQNFHMILLSPHSWIYSQRHQVNMQSWCLHTHVYRGTKHNSQVIVCQRWCLSMTEWIKRMCHIYTMESYSA
jgi:hypothetical protein